MTENRQPAAARQHRLPDRAVLTALALLLGSFPLMLVLLVLIDWSVTLSGLDPTEGAGAERVRSLNTLFVVLAALPLVAAAALGGLAWRRARRVAGLVVAGLAAVALAGLLALPLVARA